MKIPTDTNYKKVNKNSGNEKYNNKWKIHWEDQQQIWTGRTISKLEDGITEITQSDKQKKRKKNEESLKDLQNSTKHSNTYVL